MKNISLFDLLVVYTHGIATSASSIKPNTKLPFSIASKRTNYNNAYAYFLEMCTKNNMRAAFTTSMDLANEGDFNSYWLFQKKKWIKVNQPCYSQLIFDKFSPINEKQRDRHNTLFSNSKIKPFNGPELYSLFFDKQKTYEYLKPFTIPTVLIKNNSQESIDKALKALKILVAFHPCKNDFSKKLVVKDRFGAGGNNIYCISPYKQKAKIFDILQKNKNTSFVLQPFTRFEKGYKYKNYSGFIDIRMIYLRGKIVQVYIRTAKKKDFRCNEHQGGALVYISKKDVPRKVLQVSSKIVSILNEKNALYALDFVISNKGNVYLMEGNNGPGIDWNLSLKKNERMAKKLIRLIVLELAQRVKVGTRKSFLFPPVTSQEVLTHKIALESKLFNKCKQALSGRY
jgi:glutathione synthase/RimK-type ligase-like ATP-grasp enzyme